eukprot:gene18696-20584_t
MADTDSLLRKRKYKPSWAKGEPDYDPDLPYGPDVFLARKKKPDSWWVKYVEAIVIIGVLLFFVYMYFYIDHLHFHVTRAYANVGSSHAQHNLAHKYLHGRGVDKDPDMAMYWFRESAKNGHGQAAYNLVAGHLQGYNTDVQEHEIEPLLRDAHKQGVEEAERALKDMYPHKY